MDQQDRDPLQNFQQCIVDEELIIPDTDNEDENGESYDENYEQLFDSNSNDEKDVSKLQNIVEDKSKVESKIPVTNKFEGNRKVYTSNDTNATMKNRTKAYCSSCHKNTQVIAGKARCSQCSTALIYVCEACHTTYKYYTSLRNHLYSFHIPRQLPYKCNKCKKVFIHLSSLFAHEKICGREPKFSCDECPYRSHYKSLLRQHIIEKHTGRVHYCKICMTVFSHQRSLNRHMKCCGQKPSLHCDHCSRTFFRKDNIIGHLQRVHSEVYGGQIVQRTCKYCNVALKTYERANIHLKKCKSAPTNLSILADQPDLDAAVKNLATAHCDDCKKKRQIIRGRNSCDKCQTQLTYTCKRCGLSWPSWSCLRQHLNYMHIVS